MQHKLKILPKYFKAVQSGEKTFEIRKNDRDYKVGDTLVLEEYDSNKIEGNVGYTGQWITKEVTYILEGGQYGLEEGNCALGLKQEGIQLKNINLTGITLHEQFAKKREEEIEFTEALTEYESTGNKEHAIEEFYDTIQSKLGLLNMMGISAEEVMKEYPKHLEKLKSRPRKKVDNNER